jgi:hypothetical protein
LKADASSKTSFVTYNTMPTEQDTNKPAKPLPLWAESHAKKIFLQDIIDGETAGKKPKDIFEMHKEYKLYGPLDKFHHRYYSLKDKTGNNLAKANSDSAALAHDCLIHTMGLETSKGCGYPQWQGSDAERLLHQRLR